MKTALVTGGTRGIGAAIATALRDAGYRVAVNYAGNDEAAARFAEETGIAAYKWSIADYDACAEGVAKIEADLGPVDVLVNNAGITRDGLILRMSDEDFDQVIAVNLRSIFAACRAAARPMMKGRYGRIVNIGSVSGIAGNAGQVNYATAKAGLIGMTKSVAKELGAKGVTANVVAPGFVRTDMTEALASGREDDMAKMITVRRLGEPEDIAAAVSYLSSEQAGYVTGQVLVVDGGLVI